jgi:hypothetical protein
MAKRAAQTKVDCSVENLTCIHDFEFRASFSVCCESCLNRVGATAATTLEMEHALTPV